MLLAGSPDVEARQRVSASSLFGTPDVQHEIRLFLLVHALVFAALALLSAWLLAGVNPGRPWDAAAFALSPALALTFLINWDMLAVVLVAGALWSWARGRPLLTGVLIGLGTAVKLYPLLLLGALLVICLRDRRWRELTGVVLAGAATWLLVNAPAYLTGREQWTVFWTLQLRAHRRPRQRLAGRQPGRRPGVHRAHDQRVVLRDPRRSGARAWRCWG